MIDSVFGTLLSSTEASEASDPLDRSGYERTMFQQEQASGTGVLTEIQARLGSAAAWIAVGTLNGNSTLLLDGPYGTFRAVRDATTTEITVYYRSDRYAI